MTANAHASPVIVGIDGSKSALKAAVWATDEAVQRDAILRLVHVVDVDDDHVDDALADGRHALHQAWTLVQSLGVPVKMESEIVFGRADEELVTAGKDARMICVGAKGRGHSSGHRGKTAEYVARHAGVPVAIVRRRHVRKAPTFHRWIIAVLSDEPGCTAVLQAALREARLRDAPVLALTSWSTTLPQPDNRPGARGLHERLQELLDEPRGDDADDIDMSAIPVGEDILNVIKASSTIDQLVIVSSADTVRLEELLSRTARSILTDTNCSLLIGPDRRR